MATPRVSQLQSAASSRLSFSGHSTADSSRPATPAAGSNGAASPALGDGATSKYDISTVLQEPSSSGSLLPALPTLPSASSYLPSQLSSLSTTFTSAGTLPRSATPGGKSVAQRRSQAPPIQVTELRRVQKSEFDAYLKEVGGEFERWERESRLGRKGTADLRDEAEQGEEREDEDRILGLEIGEAEGGEGRRAAVKLSKPEEVLPSLDEVPPIFFDGNFNLSNPRTFDLVTERLQLSPSPSPTLGSSSTFPSTSSSSRPAPARTGSISLTASSAASFAKDSQTTTGLGPHTLTDLAADELLQDKLSHYTAVIESHLVREIGLRSGAFFAALSNLQSLHEQGEDTLSKITELQSALSASREGGVGGTARHGLQILRAQARRRGLERIEEAVRAVEDVWGAVEGVKELVEHGEWEGALEVSEGIEEAYFGSASLGVDSDSPPPASPTRPALLSSSPTKASSTARRNAPTPRLNLTKLHALSSLPVKLSLLRAQIAKSLEGELITVLEHEMDVGIEDYTKIEREGKGRRWKGKGKGHEGGEKTKAQEGETAAALVAAASIAPAGSAGAESAAAGGANGQALPAVSEAEEEQANGAARDEPSQEPDTSPEAMARERAAERVRPVVRALVRAEGMDSAVAAWRESVLREVRALVREHLPTTEAPTAEDEDHFAQVAIRSVSKQSVDLGTISEKSLSLAKKLRALSHSAFLSLARDTYLGLLACIHVVDLQARVLLNLVARSRSEELARKAKRRRLNGGVDVVPQPPPSPGSLTVPGTELPSVAVVPLTNGGESSSRSSLSTDDASTLLSTEIADVVHAVAELANVRFSKVLGVRTEVHAQLPLPDFVALFDATWAFVVQCEVVCQRMIVGLRGAAVSQAKAFLQQFHQRRLMDSARTVEEEQWAAAEVPAARQREVERIIQAAVSDPVELLLGDRAVASSAEAGENGHLDVMKEGETENGKLGAKQVDVEGKQFFAVPAGLTTIGVLVEYLMVLLNLPMLTTDCMSKIIEFMKAFNSRTCQVVLGAGAMRSAGLKNITAKHLALASQALSIMVSLIPYIRECVRRHLNPKQAVMLTEFDKLKRDYQEHQHEIHAKLVAIMSDRLQVHSRTMELIKWEESSPKPGAPNTYMESLVKEHLTLHKVLSRFLQLETVHQILGQVFIALDARLADVLAPVELKSEAAKERILVDVRYLKEKLGGLKGLEETGPAKDLEALVQSKPLPKSAAPLHAPRPSLPPRTSSMAPVAASAFESPSPNPPARTSIDAPPTPSISPLPPAAALDAVNVPLPVSTAASASTTSLALPPDAGPSASPRTSLDTSRPPSPVPVPQPLPPAPAPVAPAPYVSKKKSLADRLAERLGKKPAAATDQPPVHTVPLTAAPEQSAAAHPAAAASEGSMTNGMSSASAPDADAAGTSVASIPTIVEPSPSSPGPTTADQSSPANPADAFTPSVELEALKLDLASADAKEGASPLPTPSKEELDEVEAEVEKEVNGIESAERDTEKDEEKDEEVKFETEEPATSGADEASALPPPIKAEALVEEQANEPPPYVDEQNEEVSHSDAASATAAPPADKEKEQEKAQEIAAPGEAEGEAVVDPPQPTKEDLSQAEDAASLSQATLVATEMKQEEGEAADPPLEAPAETDPSAASSPSAALEPPSASAQSAAPAAALASDAASFNASSVPADSSPSDSSTTSAPAPAPSTVETPLPPTSPGVTSSLPVTSPPVTSPPTAPLAAPPAAPPASAPAPTPAPAAPPKKLSLKERLALAARKGSMGGSGSEAVTSPPPPPPPPATTAVTSPPPVKEEVPPAPVETVASPEAGTADLPPPVPVVEPLPDDIETKTEANGAVEVAPQAKEKVEMEEEQKKDESVAPAPAAAAVSDAEVEEEESSFL
ncbi:hypothetical protein JCM11251_004402 [Rhodosporidiobolus azoricus]